MDEHRKLLGGDEKHSVLVKGLDFALLEANKAKLKAEAQQHSGTGADRAEEKDEEDALERAFEQAAAAGNGAVQEPSKEPSADAAPAGKSSSSSKPVQADRRSCSGAAGRRRGPGPDRPGRQARVHHPERQAHAPQEEGAAGAGADARARTRTRAGRRPGGRDVRIRARRGRKSGERVSDRSDRRGTADTAEAATARETGGRVALEDRAARETGGDVCFCADAGASSCTNAANGTASTISTSSRTGDTDSVKNSSTST